MINDRHSDVGACEGCTSVSAHYTYGVTMQTVYSTNNDTPMQIV